MQISQDVALKLLSGRSDAEIARTVHARTANVAAARNIFENIAELLREGHSDTYVARTVRVRPTTVATARSILKIPNLHGPRKIEDPVAGFYERTRPVDGGHLKWLGGDVDGYPVFYVQRRRIRARVLAFRLRNGRDPVGDVRPGCEFDGCVAPDHIEDRPMRETYRQIFGGLL